MVGVKARNTLRPEARWKGFQLWWEDYKLERAEAGGSGEKEEEYAVRGVMVSKQSHLKLGWKYLEQSTTINWKGKKKLD